MRSETSKSQTHRIWIGGDLSDAKSACRRFTMRGLCVAVQPADFIYTMGMEAGVCVTLINYPRFSTTLEELEALAISLGHFLCEELCQGSFSVEGPNTTHWFSRRLQDAEATA